MITGECVCRTQMCSHRAVNLDWIFLGTTSDGNSFIMSSSAVQHNYCTFVNLLVPQRCHHGHLGGYLRARVTGDIDGLSF